MIGNGLSEHTQLLLPLFKLLVSFFVLSARWCMERNDKRRFLIFLIIVSFFSPISFASP